MIGEQAKLWWFLGYLVASWAVLAGLLWLAARRRYYFHLVPFVVAYAVLAAIGLSSLGLRGLVWWYLALTSLPLFAGLLRHLRSESGVAAFAALEDHALEAIPEGDIKQQVAQELAPRRATLQDAIISAVVFVIAFLATFRLIGRIG
jgi:hypothetical protein